MYGYRAPIASLSGSEKDVYKRQRLLTERYGVEEATALRDAAAWTEKLRECDHWKYGLTVLSMLKKRYLWLRVYSLNILIFSLIYLMRSMAQLLSKLLKAVKKRY